MMARASHATQRSGKGSSRETRSRSLLNILSIRSVIRKPPTTFVEEHATATKPKAVLKGLWPAPATTREPTSEIPDMAFVADMSGV
jgi:hypothetical protein